MDFELYKLFFRDKSYRSYRAKLFNFITAALIGGLFLGFVMLILYFVNQGN